MSSKMPYKSPMVLEGVGGGGGGIWEDECVGPIIYECMNLNKLRSLFLCFAIDNILI